MKALAPKRRIGPAAGMTLAGVALAGLGAITAVFLWRVTAMIGLPFSIDPNEGWNAYFATAATDAGPLYPAVQSGITNNYPPLSFLLVGGLGRIFGDAIIVGRIVALVSFLFVTGGLYTVARRLGAQVWAATFGALLFASGLLVFTDYVGMNDPQMLAHALAMAGLLIVLSQPNGVVPILLAAGLFALAFFVKHNILAMAGATALWLILTNRTAAIRFVVCEALFVTFGLVLFRMTYGIDMWKAVATARTYSLDLLWSGLGRWLIWNGVPLIAGLMLCRCANMSPRHLRAFGPIYGGLAIASGLFFLGGAGVDANAMFDADMALALAVALALSRIDGATGRAILAIGAAIPILWGGLTAIQNEGFDADFLLHPGAYAAAVSNADIAFMKAHPGPALCALPSFCYWSAKPFAVDVFNLSEQFKTGASDATLAARIGQHEFSVIQFDVGGEGVLGLNIERTVKHYYRLDHTDDAGQFYVPKT